MTRNKAFDEFGAWVRQRTDGIRVGVEALQRAEQIVGTESRVRTFYQEWIEDVIADPSENDEHYQAVTQNPNGHFLTWLSERYRDPYRVSHRHLHAAVKRTGDVNFVMSFRADGWPRELDKAAERRSSLDDRTAVMAEAFLEVAQRDPGNTFQAVLGIYMDRLDANPLAWRAPAAQREDSNEPPAYETYMAKNYTALFDRMSARQQAAYAQEARAKADRQQATERWRQYVADMIRRPVSWYPAAIINAVAQGLDAHALCEIEREYLGDIMAQRVDIDSDPPYRGFLDRLRTGAFTRPALPSRGEDARRRSEIAQLDTDWIEVIPGDLRPGGDIVAKMRAWQRAVAQHERTPARDTVLDFVVHLKEEGRLGASSDEETRLREAS